MQRELDQLGRFLNLVVEHKHRIGFEGTILIEPKPFEPTKHQYDYDVAAVYGFLQRYGLEHEIKVNIEVNHATLVGARLRARGRRGGRRRDLRIDRRERRRRPPGLGPRPLPGVGRADDARDARDPARRRVHDRRPQLRRQAPPPVDRTRRPLHRPHRRHGHDGPRAARGRGDHRGRRARRLPRRPLRRLVDPVRHGAHEGLAHARRPVPAIARRRRARRRCPAGRSSWRTSWPATSNGRADQGVRPRKAEPRRGLPGLARLRSSGRRAIAAARNGAAC